MNKITVWTASAVVTVAAALALTGCAGRSVPATAGGEAAGAAQVSAQLPPTPTPAPPQSCSQAQLAISAGANPGPAMGRWVTPYSIKNSGSTCSLVTGDLDFTYTPVGGTLSSVPLQVPDGVAVLSGGDVLTALSQVPTTCASTATSTITARLKDDGSTVANVSLPSIAGCAGASFNLQVPDAQSTGSGPFSPLLASISDAAADPTGANLVFTGTLTNTTSSAFLFASSCPNYKVIVNFSGKMNTETYQLPCAQAVIPAGQTITFPLSIPIPSGASGYYRIYWGIDNGPSNASDGTIG